VAIKWLGISGRGPGFLLAYIELLFSTLVLFSMSFFISFLQVQFKFFLCIFFSPIAFFFKGPRHRCRAAKVAAFASAQNALQRWPLQ
jgi:hypothetical protein